MLTLYCPNCASPNFYTLVKPNFCSKCSYSFVEAKVSKSTESINKLANEVKQEIQAATKNTLREKLLTKRARQLEEIEITELPDINSLEIEPMEDLRKNGLKLGDLLDQSAKIKKEDFEKSKINRPKGKKMSKKEILAEFQAEASNIKGNIEVGENEGENE